MDDNGTPTQGANLSGPKSRNKRTKPIENRRNTRTTQHINSDHENETEKLRTEPKYVTHTKGEFRD